MFKVPEELRLSEGMFRSDASYGNNGAFVVKLHTDFNEKPVNLFCIASDQRGWEHVSVSIPSKNARNARCPTWEEMDSIKGMFWDEEDVVIQIHPKKSEYVNNHPHCLHLWRKVDTNDFVETPPPFLIGFKIGKSSKTNDEGM